MNRPLGPLEVTERMLAFARRMEGRKWCHYTRINADGRPWTIRGRLAQAQMWRQYAGAWDGIPVDRGYVGWPHGHRVILDQRRVEEILKVSKRDCIRRARANLYLIRRMRRGAV